GGKGANQAVADAADERDARLETRCGDCLVGTLAPRAFVELVAHHRLAGVGQTLTANRVVVVRAADDHDFPGMFVATHRIRSLVMKVKELMTPDPTCCTPETSLEAVARLMVDVDCGA